MKRAIMVAAILLLALSTLAFNSFVMVKGETDEVGFVIKMSVTYYNNGTNIWNFTEREEDRAISLFANNTWQTVQLTNYSYGLETTTVDEDGNPIAVLSFPKSELQPGENISYTVAYSALSNPRSLPNIKEEDSETLEDIPNNLTDRYCGAEGPWLVNNSELQDLAQNIAENETKVLTIVKEIIIWIRDNVAYKTHETPLYPNETYTKRKGDCDDQAILFITLCRILGIPSYLQVGCMYLPTYFDDSEYWDGHVRSVLKRVGWHGWAMVYVPPWGWLPVDLTYVISGLGDPLNAIKNAAVVYFQEVIQYMNITRTDYVASSRMDRDFLKKNDFYVYAEDEMIRVGQSPWEGIIESWLNWIIIVAVMASVALVGVFAYIWKAEKQRSKERLIKEGSQQSCSHRLLPCL